MNCYKTIRSTFAFYAHNDAMITLKEGDLIFINHKRFKKVTSTSPRVMDDDSRRGAIGNDRFIIVLNSNLQKMNIFFEIDTYIEDFNEQFEKIT